MTARSTRRGTFCQIVSWIRLFFVCMSFMSTVSTGLVECIGSRIICRSTIIAVVRVHGLSRLNLCLISDSVHVVHVTVSAWSWICFIERWLAHVWVARCLFIAWHLSMRKILWLTFFSRPFRKIGFRRRVPLDEWRDRRVGDLGGFKLAIINWSQHLTSSNHLVFNLQWVFGNLQGFGRYLFVEIDLFFLTLCLILEVLRLTIHSIRINGWLRIIFILLRLFVLFFLREGKAGFVFEPRIDHTTKRTVRFQVLLIHVDVVFRDIVYYTQLFFLQVLARFFSTFCSEFFLLKLIQDLLLRTLKAEFLGLLLLLGLVNIFGTVLCIYGAAMLHW